MWCVGRGALLAWGLVFVAAGSVCKAEAAPITFHFTGTVKVVDPPLTALFAVGDHVSGFYTFEPNTPDTDPQPTAGLYGGAVSAFSFTLNSYTASYSAGGIGIVNDHGDVAPIDDYRVAGSPPLVGAPVAGRNLFSFDLDLRDSTHTALNSPALQATPPDPSAFDPSVLGSFANLFVLFRDPNDTGVIVPLQQVAAHIDSITGPEGPPAPASGPPGYLTIGAAVLALVLLAQRRRRFLLGVTD